MDYTKYTLGQLHECLYGIDKEKYPENHARLIQEIHDRENRQGESIPRDEILKNDIHYILLRRFVSLIIDLLLLAAVGAIIVNLFDDFLRELGSVARIFGYLIAGAYFTFLESRLGNGHTLGQFLLKIRVTNGDHSFLSIPQSIRRFNAAFLLYFVDGLLFDPLPESVAIHSFLGAAYIYVLLLNLYILAITKFKFTLSDLVSRSQVNGASSTPFERKPIRRAHLYIQISGFAAIVIYAQIPATVTIKPLQGLNDAYSAITKFTKHNNVQVFDNATTVVSTDSTRTTHTYVITLINLRESNLDSLYAQKVAKIAYDADSSARRADNITINIASKIDIGIYSQNSSSSFSYSPATIAARFDE